MLGSRQASQPQDVHYASGKSYEMKILGQELTTLSTFDVNLPSPDHHPEDVRDMKNALEKYRSTERFESKSGLENHFQVKHWLVQDIKFHL